MDIVNHKMCTSTICAPSDMQDGSYSALPVYYHDDADGTWAISFWKPTPAEIATINDGGGVTLYVRAVGRRHPVVSLGVYEPESAPRALQQAGPVYRCVHCCAGNGEPHAATCQELTNPTVELSLPAKAEGLNTDAGCT